MELKADFHIHTKYSHEPKLLKFFGARARYGPEAVFKRAEKIGLDVIAITDHDTMNAANMANKIAKRYRDIIFLKGEEITTTGGHLLGLGIDEEIPKGLSPEEAVDRIKEQGGVAIAPHPFSTFGLKHLIFKLPLDGIEVLNIWGSAFRANRRAQMAFLMLDLAEIGSSDAHSLSMIGKMYTKVEVKEMSADAVLRSIRKKQTEAFSDLTLTDFFKALFLGIGQTFISWKK